MFIYIIHYLHQIAPRNNVFDFLYKSYFFLRSETGQFDCKGLLPLRLGRFFLLLREGRAIEGEVIAYETFKQRKKKDSLRYRFRTPAGGTIEGHDRLQTAPVPLPEPGAPVTVLQERGEKKNYATLARVLEFAILQEKYERA